MGQISGKIAKIAFFFPAVKSHGDPDFIRQKPIHPLIPLSAMAPISYEPLFEPSFELPIIPSALTGLIRTSRSPSRGDDSQLSSVLNRIDRDEIVGVDNYHKFNQLSTEAMDFSRTLRYIMTDYDKRMRPYSTMMSGKYSGPLKITSTIVVTAFGPISDQHGEFTVSMFLRQQWFDDRLRLPASFKQDGLSLNHHMSKQIWTPDAYFINGRRSLVHNTTVTNLLLRLTADGSVHLSMRITVVAKCYMDLQKFPMDTHVCKLQIGSFQYPDTEIIYNWEQPHTFCDKQLCLLDTSEAHNCSVCIHASARRLIQFRLIDWSYRHVDVFNPALMQNQSVLEISFHVQRHIGYYIVQTYSVFVNGYFERKFNETH